MNTILTNLRRLLKTSQLMFRRFNNLSRVQQLTILGFIVLVIVLIYMTNRSSAIDEAPIIESRTVTLRSVEELSENSAPLEIVGRVTSVNEASIKAETSGRITVYKKLGDAVALGTVIAEFENSGERASVLQAEGAYDAAVVGLSRAVTGARSEQKDITAISNTQAQSSLNEAKNGALNTLSSTYSTLDDAIRTKTDSTFSNPSDRTLRFLVSSQDSATVMSLETQRFAIESMLKQRLETNSKLTKESNLEDELSKIESEARMVKSYLDDMIYALNKGIPSPMFSQSTIDGLIASASVARSAVIGQLSAISGSKENLNARIAAQNISDNQVKQVSAGDANDVLQAQAGVKQTLGVLRGAQSRLEKTIVRAPFAGTINRIAVTTGDYVAPYTDVAVVSNNSALEIVANISEEDSSELILGDEVSFSEGMKGVITKIAPALDPVTRKIEIRIGLRGDNSKLVNGQSLNISIARNGNTKKVDAGKIQIPLSAVKITPTGAVVFTVSASSTLTAHPVKQGSLLGDQIVIDEGITNDMLIVVDARGLQEGMNVKVSK